MNIRLITATAVASIAFVSGAFADTAATADVQRDVNQQQRIEQGLKSGQLNTKEASKLEREETKVERDQTRALKDGTVSAQEQHKLTAEENKVSRDIYQQKHDAQTGNPNSASSQRMQADVQRDVNQQQRIGQGLKSGQVTNREAAKLEHGQARDTAREARAGADGHVGAAEQKHIQAAEDRQSHRIYRKKHNG